MKTPPHVVAYRSVTVTIALLILLGPASAWRPRPARHLHSSASPVTPCLDRISR